MQNSVLFYITKRFDDIIVEISSGFYCDILSVFRRSAIVKETKDDAFTIWWQWINHLRYVKHPERSCAHFHEVIVKLGLRGVVEGAFILAAKASV